MHGKSIPISLSAKDTFTLHLIREELKSRKFFHILQQVGLDDCYYQTNLDSLILTCLDLDDDTDETFRKYEHIMEKRIKKITAHNDSIMKQAIKIYRELSMIKRRTRE